LEKYYIDTRTKADGNTHDKEQESIVPIPWCYTFMKIVFSLNVLSNRLRTSLEDSTDDNWNTFGERKTIGGFICQL